MGYEIESCQLQHLALLVGGDPIADIKPIENPGRNFLDIMNDCAIHKNTLG
jgi:hypothetical protein